MAVGVPPDGDLQLGSVRLPPGRQIPPAEDGPMVWATTVPVPDPGVTWLRLLRMRQETGLVPFLLAFEDDTNDSGRGRPWDSGEVGSRYDLADADVLDAADVLAQSWADSLDPDSDDPDQLLEIAPYTMRFPGLARATTEPLTDGERARAFGALRPARIGLVPARRPADVLALAGFDGGTNRYGGPAELVSVLRSWEDRFGALLVEVGYAHYRLLVDRPPRTPEAAQPIAAELWAMSDEFWPIDRPGTALTGIPEIADYIVDEPFWALWLD